MSKKKVKENSPDEFLQSAQGLVEWIADYLRFAEDYPVSPKLQPGQIRVRLPAVPPLEPEASDEILADFKRLILPGLTHWNHPKFFGYFNSTGSEAGILAELLTAALNVNCMTWQSCPAATELEQTTLDWLRRMLGLPEDFWGIIYEGGSLSSFHALAAARENCAQLQIREKGLFGREDLPPLRLYTTAQAHSSIQKAAITLGIGLENVRLVETDENYAMIAAALSEAVFEDRRKGFLPFCAAATIGATSSTAVDPVGEIARICDRENLWLHVDASHGGVLAMLPEKQDLFAGWEKADSIVVNPHKWLFVPLDLSVLYTRRPQVLRRAFSLVPEYLTDINETETENYMDYGIALARRFRALKLWFVIRNFGREGLKGILRKHLSLAREFAARIENEPEWELLAPVLMSTVCFRAKPAGLENETDLEEFNKRLLRRVNESGEAFMTHTKLGEKFTIRLVISHLKTERRHVEAAWNGLRKEFSEITENLPPAPERNKADG